MIVYETVFTVSTILMIIGYKYRSIVSKFMGLLSIIGLYTFADFNNINDRIGYSRVIWNKAIIFREEPFSWFSGTGGMEKSYLFINYLTSQFTSSINGMFFIVITIQVIIIFYSLNSLRATISVPFAWWIYLHTSYIASFAQIRQGIAVTVSILIFTLILRKNYKTSLIVFAVGMILDLHGTFIISLFLFVILILIKVFKNSFGLLFLIYPFLFFLIPIVAPIVSNKLFARYSYESGSGIFLGQFFMTFILIVIITLFSLLTVIKTSDLYTFSKSGKYTFEDKYILLTSYASLYVLLLQPFLGQTYRIREYFLSGFIVGFPYFIKKMKHNKLIMSLLGVLGVLLYIFFIYYSKNYANILPYKFTFERGYR